MGEAAPAQPAVGGFVSMLGVGMLGSMPGRASGPLAASRGSAVPQLHSAIVERLRARIELCRRHHSTCESRYQRGQAETSDREHENTLHLLNLVHQSAGNRKIRGSRSVGQQSSGTDFNRLNSEQRTQNSETEPKAVSRNLVRKTVSLFPCRFVVALRLSARRHFPPNLTSAVILQTCARRVLHTIPLTHF